MQTRFQLWIQTTNSTLRYDLCVGTDMKLKITMINVLKFLVEKVSRLQKQSGDFAEKWKL